MISRMFIPTKPIHKLFSFIIALALLGSMLTVGVPTVHATDVGGIIDTDTTWTLAGSPYTVTSNVLVMEGVTLTIEPGVEVKFNAGKALQIDGELIAQGTDANPITFTSNVGASPGAWGYILFTDSSVDATYDSGGNYLSGSIIQYAVIEYAGGASVSDNGVLRIDASSPFVDRTTIRHGASNGIRVFNNGAPKMTHNAIADNTGRGISVSSDGTIEISHSTISNNGGCGIDTSGTVMLLSNSIESNHGGGICASSGTFIITGNDISDNSGAGISTTRSCLAWRRF